MADPLTLTILTLGIGSIATTGLSAGIQARQTNKARSYQQQVSEQNAQLATAQAEAAAKQVQQENRRRRASESVQMAAAGVDIASGSFMDLTASNERGAQFDVMNTLYKGQLAARGQTNNINVWQSQMKNPWAEAGTSMVGQTLKIGTSVAMSKV